MTDKDETLEGLPMHALRAKLKELGVPFKTTHKKAELIQMLLSGKTIEEKREPVIMPTLEPRVSSPVKAIMPKAIADKAEQMGVRYEIDEETCSVTFFGQLNTCCTLDQSERNIERTLMETRARVNPSSIMPTDDTRPMF